MPNERGPTSKEIILDLLNNFTNICLYVVVRLAEKMNLLGWIYPQLRNQPNLPKLVHFLESEVRRAELPMCCVLVDIETPFVFFHWRPLIRISKKNIEIMVQRLIKKRLLPINTFVREKDNLFILLVEREWIAAHY